MKLRIHTQSAWLTVFIPLVLVACQKKEIPGSGGTATDTTHTSVNKCPTCSFPDTAWVSAGSGPRLIFKFKFDSTQFRLDNLGSTSFVLTGNAAQSPVMNGMSANYIELMPTDTTGVGRGVILYAAEETNCGGAKALVHCKSVVVKQNEIFFSIPLNQVQAGSYKWLRISLAYQNFTLKVRTTSAGEANATLAYFTAPLTYVSKIKIKNAIITPTLTGAGNKAQGYWAYYSQVFGSDIKLEGITPHTTIVNPNNLLPNGSGSSWVYGEFLNSGTSTKQVLVITGNETQDRIITISVSTNKCAEWKEFTFDGIFQPEIGEVLYDCAPRGIIPSY